MTDFHCKPVEILNIQPEKCSIQDVFLGKKNLPAYFLCCIPTPQNGIELPVWRKNITGKVHLEILKAPISNTPAEPYNRSIRYPGMCSQFRNITLKNCFIILQNKFSNFFLCFCQLRHLCLDSFLAASCNHAYLPGRLTS